MATTATRPGTRATQRQRPGSENIISAPETSRDTTVERQFRKGRSFAEQRVNVPDSDSYYDANSPNTYPNGTGKNFSKQTYGRNGQVPPAVQQQLNAFAQATTGPRVQNRRGSVSNVPTTQVGQSTQTRYQGSGKAQQGRSLTAGGGSRSQAATTRPAPSAKQTSTTQRAGTTPRSTRATTEEPEDEWNDFADLFGEEEGGAEPSGGVTPAKTAPATLAAKRYNGQQNGWNKQNQQMNYGNGQRTNNYAKSSNGWGAQSNDDYDDDDYNQSYNNRQNASAYNQRGNYNYNSNASDDDGYDDEAYNADNGYGDQGDEDYYDYDYNQSSNNRSAYNHGGNTQQYNGNGRSQSQNFNGRRDSNRF